MRDFLIRLLGGIPPDRHDGDAPDDPPLCEIEMQPGYAATRITVEVHPAKAEPSLRAADALYWSMPDGQILAFRLFGKRPRAKPASRRRRITREEMGEALARRREYVVDLDDADRLRIREVPERTVPNGRP